MRVAILTESFAPEVNGVANTVLRVAEHLASKGHQPYVIAPEPRRRTGPAPDVPYDVLRLPSVPMPGYANVRLALPTQRIRRALTEFGPDVVHLASPFVLGAWGAMAAQRLGLPMVAVYQTDVPGYTDMYGLGWTGDAADRWLTTIHRRAARTLAPSTETAAKLVADGVPEVLRWGRGVDSVLFTPAQRSDELRRQLVGDARILVGYVGRIAKEKSVELLSEVVRLPGVQVVVVGDGPARRRVEQALPGAVFTGALHGAELARIYASLDIFVHTGARETFGQTIQEAQASGLPVIAPAAGGPLDLVVPGVTGLLVNPGDPAGFAAAVGELAADPPLRARMASAARAAVEDRTWAAIGDELIGHYEAVTSTDDSVRRAPALVA